MEGFFARDTGQVARAMVKDISRFDSLLSAVSEIALVIPAEAFKQSGKKANRVRLTDSSSQSPPPDAPSAPEANGEDSQQLL